MIPMKKNIYILLLLLSLNTIIYAAATTYTSKAEYSGDWSANSTWVGGTAPTSFTNNDVININGTVTVTGSIVIDKQVTINVYDGDTLVVAGTLDLQYSSASGYDINVIGTGVVMVLGTLTTNSNLNVSNTGTLIVLGNLSSGGGTNVVTNTGDVYVLGSSSTVTVNTSGSGSFGGLDQLLIAEPDLVNYMIENFPSLINSSFPSLINTTPLLYAILDNSDWSSTATWSTSSSGSSCNCIPSDYTEANLNGKNIVLNSSKSVAKLVVNGNGTLTLNSDLTIKNALTLTSGIIISNSHLYISKSASISGGSNSSYVDGRMYRYVDNMTKATFPVGDAGVYAPIDIELVNASLSLYYAEYFSTAPSDTVTFGTGQNIVEVSTVEHWDIHKVSGENVYVTLNFPDLSRSTINDIDSIVLGHLTSGGTWENLGRHVSSTANSVRSNLPMTTFSEVAPATADGGALPVELTKFQANIISQNVILSWTTASEKNNDYFTIEKSTDGINFEKVSVVDGNGNSSVENNYIAKDENPFFGISYYRLKQTDFDGSYSFSKVVSVIIENKVETNVIIYPTRLKAGEEVYLNISDFSDSESIADIKIFNQNGGVIYNETLVENFTSDNEHAINLDENLSKGYYIIICDINGKQLVNKVFIY